MEIDNQSYTNLFGGIYCDIGDGPLCKECNDKIGLTRACKSCNQGYYLPNINGILWDHCEKCSEGCNDCYLDEKTNLINCTFCEEGYKLYNEKGKKDCIKG